MTNTYHYQVHFTDSNNHALAIYCAKKGTLTTIIKRNATNIARLVNADKVYIYGYKNNDKDKKIICSFDYTKDGWSREWTFYNQWEF